MSTISRYGTHAVVLAIAVVISGYATSGGRVPGLTLGAVSAQGLSSRQGGGGGEVLLGGQGTISTPIGVPTGAVTSHQAIAHTVAPGETLELLTARFGLT